MNLLFWIDDDDGVFGPVILLFVIVIFVISLFIILLFVISQFAGLKILTGSTWCTRWDNGTIFQIKKFFLFSWPLQIYICNVICFIWNKICLNVYFWTLFDFWWFSFPLGGKIDRRRDTLGPSWCEASKIAQVRFPNPLCSGSWGTWLI